MEVPPLDRREFTLRSALALLGGVTITISPGCGGGGGGSSSGGGSPTTPSTPSTGNSADMQANISNNHGHQATITAAQLVGSGSIMLNIQGAADHPHTVELSASDLSSLRNQQTVSRECSSTSAHTHMVTFSRGSDGPTGPGY
jgi:hypothetical protein